MKCRGERRKKDEDTSPLLECYKNSDQNNGFIILGDPLQEQRRKNVIQWK
jgi:hypothetical protein